MNLDTNFTAVYKLKPVIQEEATGCAIACAAALAGISYAQARKIANGMGIFANDKLLWSETGSIRRLLARLNIVTSGRETPFSKWDSLPNRALLAIKWNMKYDRPSWHWVIFIRDGGKSYVLDPKKSLKRNIRTDFGRMKPKWFIEITS